MDSADIWDIFYRPGDTSGLWFAFQLARALGDHRQRVRLFCDDVPALSVAHVKLNPDVLIQDLGHVEILDYRLASNVGAANNLIEVFDTAPPAYVERYRQRRGPGNWYTLHAPWQPLVAHTAIQLHEPGESDRHFDVQLGDTSKSAGLIRSAGPAHILRSGPQALAAARASILSLLGLSDELLDGNRTLCLSASTDIAWSKWVHVLIDADTPHCLFIEDGPLQDRIAGVFARVPGQPGASTIGALTAVFLPPLLWAVVDEIISVSDLVLTDRVDIAFRAAERGIPTINAQREGADADMRRWLFSTGNASLAGCYTAAALALGKGERVPDSMLAYLNSLDEFHQHARQLQDRIGRASDLVSLMLTASEVRTAATIELLFAPTRPNPML